METAMHPAPDTPTAHPTGAGVLLRDRIEDAAFQVWQDMQAADFRVLMAYRHGNGDDLAEVRKHLAKAIARIDAAMAVVADEVDDDEVEEDSDGDVWLSPEDCALDAADNALMRRQEDERA
jgi:hypothetical protein